MGTLSRTVMAPALIREAMFAVAMTVSPPPRPSPAMGEGGKECGRCDWHRNRWEPGGRFSAILRLASSAGGGAHG
jgi:hypothetical protein